MELIIDHNGQNSLYSKVFKIALIHELEMITMADMSITRYSVIQSTGFAAFKILES